MDAATSADEHRSAQELVREANHRIANHLTLLTAMIQLQIDGLKTGPELLTRRQASDHLRAAVARIVSIGNLHRRLSALPEESIDLAEFLSGSRTELLTSLAVGNRIHVEERLSSGCAVTAEQASIVSLVIGEIIVNALKYAHPTGGPVFLRLSCARARRNIVVEIADDGVGLPEGFDEKRDGGVGFKLMRNLLRKIGARLTYKSSPQGLAFRITVPPIPTSD